jgi:hypothetical protein
MIWTINSLVKHVTENHAHIDGIWVPARPVNGRYLFWLRVRAAWSVLRGKADAVVWPGGQ